jgi:hypothetical protein
MTFQPGQSGNPAGRPIGARGKGTVLAEGMLEGEAQEIIRAAIDQAKSGDVAAIRVCLDRLAPRARDRVVAFELPPLRSAASALSALADVAAAVGRSELTPAEAGNLSKLLERYVATWRPCNSRNGSPGSSTGSASTSVAGRCRPRSRPLERDGQDRSRPERGHGARLLIFPVINKLKSAHGAVRLTAGLPGVPAAHRSQPPDHCNHGDAA